MWVSLYGRYVCKVYNPDPDPRIMMADDSTRDAPAVSRAEYENLEAKYVELKSMYNVMQGKSRELTAQNATMQNILLRVAEEMGVHKHIRRNDMSEDGQELQYEDYHALVEGIEKGMDATIAAQNGRRIRGDGRHRVWYRMGNMDEHLQDDDSIREFTGLDPLMFEYVVHKVKMYMEAHRVKLYYDVKSRKSDPGNRSKLKIRYIVFMVLFRKRLNMTPSRVGKLFGMSRTTVERQCQTIDGVLENTLPTAPTMAKSMRLIKTSSEFAEFTGGSLLQDGTLTPAPDSRDADNEETSGFSGKHHRPGFNTVVTCTGKELLVGVSKTAPGNWHDFRIIKNNPLDLGLWKMLGKPKNKEAAKVMENTKMRLDLGFVGYKKIFTNVKTCLPHKGKNKKSPKDLVAAYKSKDKNAIAAALGLTPEQYDENRALSSERSLVERVIGKLKRWDVLGGIFRGTASELNRQFVIVSGLLNLSLLWPEIEREEHRLLVTLAENRAKFKKRR